MIFNIKYLFDIMCILCFVANCLCDEPGCGLRSPNLSKDRSRRETNNEIETQRQFTKLLIVGGNDVSSPWPWMVGLYHKKTFLSGASLISRKYVLTCAHSFNEFRRPPKPSQFTVLVGSNELMKGTEYAVEHILIHPRYTEQEFYNDIALLRLETEVTLTEKVYPVCLPSDELMNKINLSSNIVTVTGWGHTKLNADSNSEVLQEIHIPIVSVKECNEAYSNGAFDEELPNGITNQFICAGSKEGGKDACQNDSGGPMVAESTNNTWIQLGIVGFGYECGHAEYPGVYTRVSYFMKWIFDNTDLGKK